MQQSYQDVARDAAWLESIGRVDGAWAYRVPQRTADTVEAVVALTNDLLPDFFSGQLRAHVTAASLWDRLPKVILEFLERGATQCADVVELAGAGAARWVAASLQIALHLLDDQPDLRTLRSTEERLLSGHVVLLEEPEAHLHPSAVRSVTRWCKRMSILGITLVAATHHDEFLREADQGGDSGARYAQRGLGGHNARALPVASATALRQLAQDVGMHSAAAMALHRAVLFVEGPLDVAVLDEYGSLLLDAAGVPLGPVHGTKNLEGLV